MNDIIILSDHRTGSSLLNELFVAFDNNLKTLGEYFILPLNDERHYPHYKYLTQEDKIILYHYFNLEEKNLHTLIDKIHNDPKKSYTILDKLTSKPKVIKCQISRIEELGISFLLEQNKNFIFLERRDILAKFVSQKICNETNIWWNTNTSNLRIIVDPLEFIKYKTTYQTQITYYKKFLIDNNKNFLNLTYEDDIDVDDFTVLYNKLETWLKSVGYKVYRKNYFPNHKKQNHSLMSEKVVNYDEIKNLLIDSK